MGANDRVIDGRLLIATRNKGKITNYADLIKDLDIDWISLEDLGTSTDVKEDGKTYLENATKKALVYAEESGLLTLADDSGLEVDALGGKPGVKTARFGGLQLSTDERYLYLLNLMNEVPQNERSARFRCVIVLARPAEVLCNAVGVCHGLIANQPAGQGGFGYDPIFFLPEFHKTMAEVDFVIKQRISHRARAFAKIRPQLLKYVR